MLAAEHSPFGRIVEALQPQASVLVLGPLAAAKEVGARVARACGLPCAPVMSTANGQWSEDLGRQKIAWPEKALIVSVATDPTRAAFEKFDVVLEAHGFPGGADFGFYVVKGPQAAFNPMDAR